MLTGVVPDNVTLDGLTLHGRVDDALTQLRVTVPLKALGNTARLNTDVVPLPLEKQEARNPTVKSPVPGNAVPHTGTLWVAAVEDTKDTETVPCNGPGDGGTKDTGIGHWVPGARFPAHALGGTAKPGDAVVLVTVSVPACDSWIVMSLDGPPAPTACGGKMTCVGVKIREGVAATALAANISITIRARLAFMFPAVPPLSGRPKYNSTSAGSALRLSLEH